MQKHFKIFKFYSNHFDKILWSFWFFEFRDENNGYHDEDDNNGNGGLTMMKVLNVNENISKRKSDIENLVTTRFRQILSKMAEKFKFKKSWWYLNSKFVQDGEKMVKTWINFKKEFFLFKVNSGFEFFFWINFFLN